MSKLITPYILEKEYRCRCCRKLPPDFYVDGGDLFEHRLEYLMLFKYFQDIREAWGKPINITSGYRCPERNKDEGGSYLSVHMWGLALDLDCKDDDEVSAMAAVIQGIAPNLRIGIYKGKKTFIHIDVGYMIQPRALDEWHKRARWTK